MIKGCILPWVHLFGTIDGSYKICCFSEYDKNSTVLGTSNQKPTEVWNSSSLKTIRKQFLNGEIPLECKAPCYDKEALGDQSPRQNKNIYFGKFAKLQSLTKEDGHLSTKPIFLDIRFGNICNFKCRMCGPGSSTSWYSDNPVFRKPIDNYTNNPVFWDDIPNILPYVEEIYFAGGEPFVQDGHFKLINLLIEKGYANKINLSYNTNLSFTVYKNNDIKNLWSNFKSVRVWPSCEGFGKQVEYSRKGFQWDIFSKNCIFFKDFIQEISSVINIYSILSMPDLILWLKTNNLSFWGTTQINPEYQSITILPNDFKKIINKLYHKFLKTHGDKLNDSEVNNILNWLSFMNAKDDSHLLPTFKKMTEKYDKTRNESFLNVFPEYKKWYETI